MRCLTLTIVLFVSSYTRVLCSAADPLAREYGDLVFVSLLYRHGDRAIAERSYPNDPYRNESYWPMGFGQLTNEGKERHYEFGKWIRNRYGDFLPAEYSNKDIYVRSTSIDRALMSAAVNLAGLYKPSNKSEQWNSDLGALWQPIPIHSIPRELDQSLTFGENCPRYKKEYDSLQNLPEIKRFNEKHRQLYDYLRKHTGMNFTTDAIDYSSTLYDNLLVETQFNYILPNWTTPVFPEKLKKISELSFLLPTYTPLLKKLSCGVLLKEITDKMDQKRNGILKPDIKFHIYSAHDTNVAGLLNSLNVYNYIIPPYASAVFLELRKKETNNTYVVTVLYRNTSVHDPYLLHVPGCDSIACDLDQFINIVKPIMLTNWYEECHKDVGNNLLIYSCVIVIILIAVSLAFFVFHKKYFVCYCGRNYQKLYHAVPREETETVDWDQDGRSRVAISFRMNGVDSNSADV